MPEVVRVRAWRMLGAEALRGHDRELARTLTDPARLLELGADDQVLLARLRALMVPPAG